MMRGFFHVTSDIVLYPPSHHLTVRRLFVGIFFRSESRLEKYRNPAAVGTCFRTSVSNSIFLIGTEFSDEIYPFVVHLPLLLILVFYYKFRWLQSLTSILTAYLCCQYSNWAGIFVLTLTHEEWCYYLCRILVTLIVFFLLCKYLCPTTALLFEKSDRELNIICSNAFCLLLCLIMPQPNFHPAVFRQQGRDPNSWVSPFAWPIFCFCSFIFENMN